jgi:F420-non-reducing hydrogenase iron-sulfur subunit
MSEAKASPPQDAASGFEPRIVGIFCNWCTYTASDLAGTARMSYAPNVRILRVMCSGRVDPQFILTAFRQGADGVLIGGCHPNDCHYQEGNYKALRRVTLLKRVLESMGIEKERLRLEWIAASEGEKLQKVANDMTEKLRKLGPLRLEPMKGADGAEHGVVVGQGVVAGHGVPAGGTE